MVAVLVLGETTGTSAEKFTAQHLPGSVVLSVSWGKEKHWQARQ